MKNAFSANDVSKNFISFGSEFMTLRYPDYTGTDYRINMLLHLLMPSMQTKV